MKVLLAVIGVIALIIGLALLFALPTMLLWNWLMPVLFGLVKITFWQALGINILSGILLKSNTTTNSSK